MREEIDVYSNAGDQKQKYIAGTESDAYLGRSIRFSDRGCDRRL